MGISPSAKLSFPSCEFSKKKLEVLHLKTKMRSLSKCFQRSIFLFLFQKFRVSGLQSQKTYLLSLLLTILEHSLLLINAHSFFRRVALFFWFETKIFRVVKCSLAEKDHISLIQPSAARQYFFPVQCFLCFIPLPCFIIIGPSFFFSRTTKLPTVGTWNKQTDWSDIWNWITQLEHT